MIGGLKNESQEGKKANNNPRLFSLCMCIKLRTAFMISTTVSWSLV